MLAGFALLFADFATAQQRLVEEPHEEERFGYFRRQFLLCHRRCAVIAEHLSRHVAAVTGRHVADGRELAALIVRSLAADENKAVSGWESDGGAMPALTWPVPAGGALAALLGLTGTGLPVVYTQAGGTAVWRDTSGPMSGFGTVRDRENCPVPTVLPSLAATLSPAGPPVRERAQRLADEGRDRRVARRRAGLHRHLVRGPAGRAGGHL